MEYPLFASLSESEQHYLTDLNNRYHLSYQQMRMLIENALDLELWQQGPLRSWIDESVADKLSGKNRASALVSDHLMRIQAHRLRPTDYSNFHPMIRQADKYKSQFVSSETIMGRCPCPAEGELTRCCNLKTLDAVQQCAFGCSYCSIQSFYNSHEIRVVQNLKQRLEALELDESTWHLGTGQSSDSLLWGDDYGTLEALAVLARRYPDLIIELKTKSRRTDWLELDLPANIVATWSLNAPTIIEKEEHFTPSLAQRLEAACRARDAGRLVGFHLHPMVWFEGWQQEYGRLIEQLVSSFSPSDVMMVSFGTLAFTKSVLRNLRSNKIETRVTDLPLTMSAGKYTYPREIREQLFTFAYSRFPSTWKNGTPFFYLCMEDPLLWQPVFGYQYQNNAAFEAAMKVSYQGSVRANRENIV